MHIYFFCLLAAAPTYRPSQGERARCTSASPSQPTDLTHLSTSDRTDLTFESYFLGTWDALGLAIVVVNAATGLCISMVLK